MTVDNQAQTSIKPKAEAHAGQGRQARSAAPRASKERRAAPTRGRAVQILCKLCIQSGGAPTRATASAAQHKAALVAMACRTCLAVIQARNIT